MIDTDLLPRDTSGIRLRRLHPCDAAAFADGTKDPAVQDYAHLPESEYTPASVVEMIHGTVDEGLQRGDLAVLAIAETPTDRFLGSLVLFDVTPTTGEVGFWLHPLGRGGGVATTALRLAGDLCRASGMESLTARTIPENGSSQRVLTKAGFIETHRQPDTTPAGARTDLVRYAISLRPSPPGS